MERSKNTKKGQTKNDKPTAPDTKWLSVRLTAQHEAELSEYAVPVVQIIDDLLVFASDGGGWTIKQTADGESFNAYAFLPIADGSSTTYAVSAFAGNPADALLVLHYKLFVLVGDDPAKWENADKRRFG